MKIKKKDQVKIMSGKDKGRTGQVLKVFPQQARVLVEGINIYKKHIKAQRGQAGTIIERERPIAVSKLSLVCPSCQKPTRVGYQIDKNKEKYRICKKCHSLIKDQKTK
jgi:large subunit ribosomal protein L24